MVFAPNAVQVMDSTGLQEPALAALETPGAMVKPSASHAPLVLAAQTASLVTSKMVCVLHAMLVSESLRAQERVLTALPMVLGALAELLAKFALMVWVDRTVPPAESLMVIVLSAIRTTDSILQLEHAHYAQLERLGVQVPPLASSALKELDKPHARCALLVMACAHSAQLDMESI